MKRLSGAILALLVGIAALVLIPGSPLHRWSPFAEPPPVLGKVADFHLVADDGSRFDAAALGGKAWLASFLYTSCPGPCPLLVERLKVLRHRIPTDRLAIVSFSVDPETDTPQVLAEYKKTRGIGKDDAWTFVTGPPAEVLDLVQHGFFTAVERGDPSAPEGTVMHSVRVALVDGDRNIRGFYATDSAEDLAHLERDVALLD